jgi:hypothetical protein
MPLNVALDIFKAGNDDKIIQVALQEAYESGHLRGKQLINARRLIAKRQILGKSFPARAAVILNYFSFLKDKLEYIAEQPSSLKLNHYISGTNIKIVNSDLLKKMKPDIIIIFAWHLFHEIKNKWKNKGLSKKTKYVLILPKLKVFK